jgi:hypothetical protein
MAPTPLVAIRHSEAVCPRRLSWQGEVEHELRGSHHKPVLGIVSLKAAETHLPDRRGFAGNPHRLHGVRQHPTAMRKIRLDAKPGDSLQRSADEPIPRGVDRELVEAARDQAAREQLTPIRRQGIYATTDPAQHSVTLLVAKAELPTLTSLHRVRQDFSDQIG